MSSSEDAFKNLVLARLQALPDGACISIGGEGTLTKEQILNHVKENDEIGKKMIEIDKAFFKALKEGTFYDYVNI